MVHWTVTAHSTYDRKRRAILWLRIASFAVAIPAIALSWSNPSLLSIVVLGLMLLHVTGLYYIERTYNRRH